MAHFVLPPLHNLPPKKTPGENTALLNETPLIGGALAYESATKQPRSRLSRWMPTIFSLVGLGVAVALGVVLILQQQTTAEDSVAKPPSPPSLPSPPSVPPLTPPPPLAPLVATLRGRGAQPHQEEDCRQQRHRQHRSEAGVDDAEHSQKDDCQHHDNRDRHQQQHRTATGRRLALASLFLPASHGSTGAEHSRLGIRVTRGQPFIREPRRGNMRLAHCMPGGD